MTRCFGSPDREWLHPERFRNEPVYCEAPHNPNDILYSGSDDDAYSSPTERRLRFETQAQRFLEGRPVFLLSASLRGPFDSRSGWVNPWRSRSNSGPRAKSNRRKRSAVQKPDGEHDSGRIVDSGSCRPCAPKDTPPKLPPAACTPPRYMDDEILCRVRHWRDRVVAETTDIPTVSVQRASQTQTEPASADSRRATQQTTRRQSGLTWETLGDDTDGSGLFAAGVANNAEAHGISSASARRDGPVSSSSAHQTGTVVGLSQATIDQACPSPSALSAAAVEISLPHTTNFSLRGVKQNGQLFLSGRETHAVFAQRNATVATRTEVAPTGEATAMKAQEALDFSKATKFTPNNVQLEAATSSTLLRTQASSRTDGSFRYRHKDVRPKGTTVGKSILGAPVLTPADATAPASPANRPCSEIRSTKGSKRLRDKDGSSASFNPETSERALPAAPDSARMFDEVAAGIEAQQPHKDAPQHSPLRSSLVPDQQRTERDSSQEHPIVDAASQIDGPTLVPSVSPPSSEHSSMPSFAHFSVEKHSQDIMSDAVGLPRRLLWPKARPSASVSSWTVFGLETAEQPQKLGSESPQPPSALPPVVSAESVLQEAISVKDPLTENTQFSGQSGHDAIADPVDRDAAPDAESTADSKTASGPDMEQLPGPQSSQVGADLASPPDGDAGTEADPRSSEVSKSILQSPWVESEEAVASKRSPDCDLQQPSENPITTANPSSPPKTTQSPWVKDRPGEDVTPGVGGQHPDSHVFASKPSVVANYVLPQPDLQSPWARGDSQMQLPAARLFNPLSSPANSHVLPTAKAITQLQGPDEDIDMCDSQLYPHRPSTPETRQSGLPTPDFTLSVKSFKDFMTPSPQPAAKRRRISTVTDDHDHLPSTQALVNAAISNPWTRPPSTNPKKKNSTRKSQQRRTTAKRVSWADEQLTTTDPSSSPHHPPHLDEPHPSNTTGSSNGHQRSRATGSPPPSILSTAKYPAANQKFGRHFAAVASRRVGMTPLKQQQRGETAARGGLLPSASQQVCASPALGAMAEAFVRADGEGGVGGDGVEMDVDHLERVGLQMRDEEDVDDEGGEDELQEDSAHVFGKFMKGEEEEEEEPQIDDVSAVMENLGDFLQSWDLDVELAKARTERERESRARRDVAGTGPGLASLMDIGVWD